MFRVYGVRHSFRAMKHLLSLRGPNDLCDSIAEPKRQLYAPVLLCFRQLAILTYGLLSALAFLFACCCWGAPTQLPFGANFTAKLILHLTAVPLNISLHLSQVYEAALVLGIIPVLLSLRKPRPFFDSVMLSYLAFSASARLLIEDMRGDPRGYRLSVSARAAHRLSSGGFVRLLVASQIEPAECRLRGHQLGSCFDFHGKRVCCSSDT